ncbi:MAG: DUF1080 domain-containing protein [Candidatus Hydrogenedentes bacterium]|nr:DUF1080 domain-containing protein [Candidatus Hydrogenedentota bacterium]
MRRLWILCGWTLAAAGAAVAAAPPITPDDEAKVLLCGDSFAAWGGDTGDWINAADAFTDPNDEKLLATKPGHGTLVNGPTGRTGHLFSAAEFGDVRAHIEFMVPKGSNSGVYFQGRYEIQVLDSWGVETPHYSDCGGIYQRWDDARQPNGYEGHAPRVNASRPPGEWQSFDLVFRAPRFDTQGAKIENARFIEVAHNGVVVHSNVELTGPTRACAFHDEQPLGPLMFQGDHGPVAYRNIRIVPYHDLPAGAAGGGRSMNPFFAMDTGTQDAAHATIPSQVAMVHELGYDGTDNTGRGDMAELLRELDRCGRRLFAVYRPIEIGPDTARFAEGLPELVALLDGRGTVLWTPIESATYAVSSPDGDAAAVEAVGRLADLAAESGLRVALYPHTGCWLERVEDAVRVARKVARPNVGVTFNLCHWLRVDGQDLDARLDLAAPHLFMVTLNGADADGRDWKTLIQPLGQGTFDVRPLLHKLDAIDYCGPIGLQGYGIGGDVHDNLSRSMAAWRALRAPSAPE